MPKRTFRHSGKTGDVIFSLPTIRQMGGGTLYLPEQTAECSVLYSNMRELLLQQPFIHDVKEYTSNLPYGVLDPAMPVDIDLDRHREHHLRGMTNMVKRYFEIFGINSDWKAPWLTVEGRRPMQHEYNLISLTSRFRDNSRVDWRRVYQHVPRPVYFIGTPQEHESFVENYGDIEYLETENLLTFALTIKSTSSLFCNQSCALSIAQGLGVTYFLEKKPHKQNCLFFTSNENILL